MSKGWAAKRNLGSFFILSVDKMYIGVYIEYIQY